MPRGNYKNLSFLGRKHTNESKIRMSISQRGHHRNIGIKFSEEHKRKISLANKGISRGLGHKVSEEVRKKMSKAKMGNQYWLGKKHTEEQKLKISLAQRGEKNHQWKGGITKKNKEIRQSYEMKLWRESVFKRDNWTCQECKQKGGYLEPDHIKPFAYFPELRFAIDNGRTLCKECHKKTDTYMGRANKLYGK